MSRLLDLDQILYNPAHRANEAIELAVQDTVDLESISDPVVRDYVHFLRTGDTSTRSLFCVASAHTLQNHEDNVWAVIIEACVLARMTNEEIAEETGIDEDIIDTYIKLFFDVRHKLHNKIWTIKTIFGKSWMHKRMQDDSKITAEEILKIFAYYGGKHVLRSLLAGLGEFEEFPQSDKDIQNWFSIISDAIISQHAIVSGLIWKPHQRGTLRLLELQGKLAVEKKKLQTKEETLEINIQQNQQNIQINQEQQARLEELEKIESTIRTQIESFIRQIPWQVAAENNTSPQVGYETIDISGISINNIQNLENEITEVQNRLKSTDDNTNNTNSDYDNELS